MILPYLGQKYQIYIGNYYPEPIGSIFGRLGFTRKGFFFAEIQNLL